ncbi:hypothetical protein B0H14DRAFT_3710208 [Mycena olivaceomarginata]|nr:hypothetical protein B0H14DRAFT_3710208 [Mycena olivaceomarginata]
MWTEIALSIPHLWTDLRVKMPLEVAPEFENMLDGWLSRGKERPLLLRSLDPPLSMQSDPRLTYLRLDVNPASRCLPEIEHCVRHARLISLRLNRTRSDSSHILRLLTLPSLRHLEVAGCAAELFSFFARSSPPLETFFFDTIGVRWDSDDKVERCFSLIPSLTTLYLTDLEEVQVALITLLARDEILPNLVSLTITRTSWQSPDAAWYRSLTNMLSLRRKTLRSFCLELPQHRYSSYPEEDVFLAPRAEEMDIYIGPITEE